MQLARLLDELTRAAERAGVRVRTEPFDPNLSDVKRPRGGMCTLRGERLILVDAKLPLPERIATIAEALADIDLDHLFLPPIVRATIGAHRAARPVDVEMNDDDFWPPQPANDAGPAPLPLARIRPRQDR